MNLTMYSIYDSKVKAWGLPFYLPGTVSVHREWTLASSDPQSIYYKHAEDYCLFEIGSFDQRSGVHTLLDSPVSIGLAIHFKTEQFHNYEFEKEIKNKIDELPKKENE